jgi:predicted MFS family arabinose efflux permease
MQTQDARTSASLWLLLVGNFLIGTGVLMPTGMLGGIAASFGVSMTSAVQLLTVSGIVIAIGAPVLASLTTRVDRRTLLTLCLLVYAIGHAVSIFVPSFAALIVVRAVTVMAAAVYSPQAAATVALLLPPEKREAAIAFIFTGWALAVVLGVPAAAFATTRYDWETVYMGMAVLCALWGLATWLILKPRLAVAALDLTAWKTVMSHPQLIAILAVTMLSVAGQFAVFSVLSPILSEAFDATAEQLPLAFISAGIGGIAGNILASRAVGRFGADIMSAASILSLIIGIAAFALAFGNLGFGLIAILIWGLGSFSVTSLQQSRLVRVAPSLASATIALNTSVLYLGQAIGVVTGSLAIQGSISPLVAWLAMPFVCAALIISVAIPHFTRNAQDNSTPVG